ncbi:MAG: PEP-CTERM sorting domain-containing protein [Cyanobacteriota bacterium]|nr:PEP-CTERM sorting domain-containing protein [Cyanobacteriota bacterium]
MKFWSMTAARTVATVSALLSGTTSATRAAVLVRGGVTQIVGSGLGEVVFVPDSGDPDEPGVGPIRDPGNNDYAETEENQNQVGIEPIRFGRIAPIDLEFVAFNILEGGTEYLFKEGVQNDTRSRWNGFQLELGFGTGKDFVRSGLLDRLDFDVFNRFGSLPGLESAGVPLEKTPDPTSTAFNTLNHQANLIEWQGGTVDRSGSMDLTFSIDLPNIGDLNQDRIPQENWLTDPDSGEIVGYKFTLRQRPSSVPEPAASLGILGFGAWGVGAKLRKRYFRSRSSDNPGWRI